MSHEAETRKTPRPKGRSHFDPTIVGYIEGLRLAAWTIEKTSGMVDICDCQTARAAPSRGRRAGGRGEVPVNRPPPRAGRCAGGALGTRQRLFSKARFSVSRNHRRRIRER